MSYTHKLYLGYIELMQTNHAPFYNLGKFNSPHYHFLQHFTRRFTKGNETQ